MCRTSGWAAWFCGMTRRHDCTFISMRDGVGVWGGARRAFYWAWCGLCCLGWVGARAQNAADVMGPDGVLYPDWSWAGVPGGIPTNLPVRVTLSAGALATNAAGVLEGAAEAAYAAGGGVVSIPAGTFNLDRAALMRRSNVVLRGAGQAATKFLFRYAAPTNGINYYVAGGVTAGPTTLFNNTWIEAHADPVNLQRLTLKANGVVLAERLRTNGHWGATFSQRTTGNSIRSAYGGTGSRALLAEAEYPGGVVRTRTITVSLTNATDANAMPAPSQLGAISFCGLGATGAKPALMADGLRGQGSITLTNGHGVAAGERIELVAPATARWNAEVGNTCTNSQLFRRCLCLVTAVTNNTVYLNQPLRIDYPIIDGAYAQELTPLVRCGVENLTVEQSHDVWTSGIIFSWAWECWAKGVRVNKAGRFPLYFNPGKWCEIRDTILDDAWFKGDGGTAYAGFERAYDCLMENTTTYKLRHAPLYQWSAGGNVIRNSFFYDSDMQWHSGWCNENLFENCVVEANRGNGAYGYGAWSSPPEDTAHGPNGPRNVVYNCDMTSPLAGAWIGGVGGDWMFLHNRIAADSGYGAYAQKSGGHIFDGNVFALKSAGAGVWLNDTNCAGVEITGNTFLGLAGQHAIAGGAIAPALVDNNATVDALSLAAFLNPGFESAWTGWTRDAGDNNMSSLAASAARSGYNGLRVTDTNAALGSSVASPAFSVSPGKTYAVRYWTRTLAGANGIGMYLQFFNSGGTQIQSTSGGVPTSAPWQQAVYQATAPSNALTAKIWVHSYGAGIQTADFDDFEFGEVAHAIANNGFEGGLAFWTTSGDGGMSAAVTNAAKSGSYGLRVTDASTTLGSSVASAKFPVQPGWTYQLRYWGRQLSGNGMGTYLEFYNASNGYVTNALKQLSAVSDWREQALRATAPAGAATVRAWLHSYSGSIVTADFDNLVLSEIPPRPQPAVPSIFAWQRNPVFPTSNPGFESDFGNWDLAGDGGMSQVVNNPSGAHGGSKYMRVTDASGTGGSWARGEPFLVQPGKTYRVAAWAKNVSGSGAGLYIQFFNASGSEIAGSSGNVTVPSSATNWTQVSVSKVAPAGAVTSKACVHSYNASIVTAEFDDFEFRRQ